MFLLLITFLKASHSFRNRLLVICKNAYLFATMIMTSVSSPFSCCSGIVRLNLDIFTFYVPHRHVYGEQWIKFMKDGVNATPLPTVNTIRYIVHAVILGTINSDTTKIPRHLFQGYLNIYNNYFKAPWMAERSGANLFELNEDDARYGFRCCHRK